MGYLFEDVPISPKLGVSAEGVLFLPKFVAMLVLPLQCMRERRNRTSR